jgi:chromosome segregation ATPase
VRSQRDEIRDRCDKLLRTCDERDKALRQLEASHAELTAAYEAATAEHERLVAALRTHAVQVSAMADRFPRVDGEEAAGVSSTIGIDLGAGQP